MKGENDKNLGIKKVQVFPIVIGALGSVKKKLEKLVVKKEISINLMFVRKTTLLGTARAMRKVLNTQRRKTVRWSFAIVYGSPGRIINHQ